MLCLGPTTVDLQRLEVHSPGGEIVPLTSNEHQLLSILAAHPNEAVPRERLLQEGLGYRAGLSTRALSHAILRLRQKLEADPKNPIYLKTIYGVGYRLDVPAPPAAAREESPGLLGRGGDLQRLGAALSSCRLVSIVGPAGVGKTTLARHHLQSAPGVFVDLSAAEDQAGILRATATALGTSLRRGPLLRSLQSRGDLLLLLDNAEQVIEAAAAVVADWLAGSGVRVLVTSRRPLGLPDEATVSLAPLELASAVALFQQRAPWLQARDDEVAPVVALLDGLPLAIELAAARSRLLSLPQLQRRLDAHPASLRVHETMLSGRRTSMHEALEGSWRLLSEEEQRALTAAAVAAAPLAAADLEALLPGAGDALHTVEALVAHSMLSLEAPGRLRVLRTIRDFVRTRAPAPLRAEQIERHEVWVLQAADRHAHGLHRGRWRTGIDALRRLEPELLLIWQRCRTDRPERAARAALALDAQWLQHGSIDTHRTLLEEAAALDGLSGELRSRLGAALGLQHIEAGEPGAAIPVLRQAACEASTLPARLNARRCHAVALLVTGEHDAAAAMLDAALAEAQSEGDRREEGILLTSISRLQLARGALDDAERSVRRALPMLRQAGHVFGEANLHERLGRIMTARGDRVGALEAYRHEKAIWATLGVTAAEATVRISEASVLLDRLDEDDVLRATFDPGVAREVLEASLVLLRQGSRLSLERFALINLMRATLLLGELDAAERHHRALESLLISAPEPGLLDWLTPLLGSLISARRGRDEETESRRRRGLLLCPDPEEAIEIDSLLRDGAAPAAQTVALSVLWELACAGAERLV
ncbi:MAG: putative ATPase/DNA-binding winged helix-turn-helix (wHTH) protein [Myxococcota bacterium]|jgi:predicted ATPase/DNA-binding winged helix-turn-helix (wHTH) protein